MIIYLKRNR